MNGLQLSAFAIAALAVAVSGCRSTKSVMADYEANLLVGKFADAVVEPSAKAAEGGRDALCWQLHAAAAERLAGNNDEAIRRFDLAEDAFIDNDSRSKAGEMVDMATSLMVGDYALPYAGAGQDRIFTCLYKAIDFGVMGKPNAVRTELNRALLHQQDWRAERSAELAATESKLQTDARSYAQSNGTSVPAMAGVADRALGDEAFSATLRATVGFDTARDGRLDLLVEDDFANVYLAQVNATFRRYVGDSGPKPHDRVAVFVEDGMCPKREEWRIDLPLLLVPGVRRYVKYAGMALPKLVYRNAAAATYSVSSSGVTHSLAPILDVDRLMKTEFDVYFRGALTREIVRAVTRVGVQVALGAARNNVSGQNARLALELIQLGVAAYGICTTEADVRSWTALPKSVYMLELPRPADGVIVLNCGTEKVKLNVPPGNTMVFVRKTSSSAPSVIKLFTLPDEK